MKFSKTTLTLCSVMSAKLATAGSASSSGDNCGLWNWTTEVPTPKAKKLSINGDLTHDKSFEESDCCSQQDVTECEPSQDSQAEESLLDEFVRLANAPAPANRTWMETHKDYIQIAKHAKCRDEKRERLKNGIICLGCTEAETEVMVKKVYECASEYGIRHDSHRFNVSVLDILLHRIDYMKKCEGSQKAKLHGIILAMHKQIVFMKSMMLDDHMIYSDCCLSGTDVQEALYTTPLTGKVPPVFNYLKVHNLRLPESLYKQHFERINITDTMTKQFGYLIRKQKLLDISQQSHDAQTAMDTFSSWKAHLTKDYF